MTDQELNDLCGKTGLVKRRLLESIGTTMPRYCSKLRHNGLSSKEIAAMMSSLSSVADRLETFEFGADQFEDLNRLKETCYVKKTPLARRLERSCSYLSSALNLKRRLPPPEIELAREALAMIASDIRAWVADELAQT